MWLTISTHQIYAHWALPETCLPCKRLWTWTSVIEANVPWILGACFWACRMPKKHLLCRHAFHHIHRSFSTVPHGSHLVLFYWLCPPPSVLTTIALVCSQYNTGCESPLISQWGFRLERSNDKNHNLLWKTQSVQSRCFVHATVLWI